jgi:hypothetical protein
MGSIIAVVSTKVREINSWQDRHKNAGAQQFYNALILELSAFHEGHRNHLAHGRGVAYTDDNAVALIGHVRRFLMRLSDKITESAVTEEIWR